MSVQAYSPFRANLITPSDLRRLNEIRPWVPVLATVVHWTLIVAAWTMVALWPNFATAVLAFFVVGVNFYGLYIIMHDGLHRRLFRSVTLNDLWNDLTMTASIGAITRINRRNHMTHHHSTCLADDPDRFKYVHEGKDVVIPFMAFLSGVSPLVTAVRNVFFKRSPQSVASPIEPSERYRLRDILLLAAWQLALIGGLSYSIGAWAYPCLWLAPTYALAYRADLVRVFCEHSMMIADEDADSSMRLITYESNWFEKLFFAPHNMNYHMAHHLWPSIPYYNLPEADRLIRASEIARKGDTRLVWRKSYVGYLISYANWRRSNAAIVMPEQSHA
ncbi:fatty acid desaturase [Bradyrhizobium sp. 25ACV]